MRKKGKAAMDGAAANVATAAGEARTGEAMRFHGVDVHVRATGSGPPVLLINGLGTHTAMWEPIERTLQGFRLLQFDLPGSGQSGRRQSR